MRKVLAHIRKVSRVFQCFKFSVFGCNHPIHPLMRNETHIKSTRRPLNTVHLWKFCSSLAQYIYYELYVVVDQGLRCLTTKLEDPLWCLVAMVLGC